MRRHPSKSWPQGSATKPRTPAATAPPSRMVQARKSRRREKRRRDFNVLKRNNDPAQGRGSKTELGQLTRLLTGRSEEHTSELQSRFDLVCRLLLEKKNACELDPPIMGQSR